MPSRPSPIAPVLAAAALLLGSARAEADQREWHFGGTLGFSQLSNGPTSAGLGAGAHLAYGVHDAFNLMAAVDFGAHPYGQWLILSGSLGAAWIIDSFQWVPWVGAMAGPAEIFSTDPLCGAAISEPCRAFRLNVQLPFGLDYRVTKRFSVGIGGKLQFVLLGDVPWMTTGAFANVEYTWGR